MSIDFTEFLRKRGESKFLQFPHCGAGVKWSKNVRVAPPSSKFKPNQFIYENFCKTRTKSLSLKSVLYLIEKASRFTFVVVHTSIRRLVQNYYPSRRSLAKSHIGQNHNKITRSEVTSLWKFQDFYVKSNFTWNQFWII